MALAIYGSVLDTENRRPHNLNVACAGQSFTRQDRAIVERWMSKHHLSLNLPIEVLEVPLNDNVMQLPVPYDMPLRAEVLGDDEEVNCLSMRCETISATLLAFGRKPRKLRSGLHEVSEVFPRGPRIRLTTDRPSWQDYHDGIDTLFSLRRALTKAPALRRLARRQPFLGGIEIAKLLLRLEKEDPRQLTDASKILVVDFKRGRVTLSGTNRISYKLKDAQSLLFHPARPTK